MEEGKIRWFNRVKGYGFIESEGNKDAFIHYTQIQEEDLPLRQGDKVVFERTPGEKGDKALNVKKI